MPGLLKFMSQLCKGQSSNLASRLREIEDWNAKTINNASNLIVGEWAPSPNADIQAHLKAVLTGRTALLAAVAADATTLPEIDISIPSTPTFVHSVLCHAAKVLCTFPAIVEGMDTGSVRGVGDALNAWQCNNAVQGILATAVESCMVNAVSSQALAHHLRATMGNTRTFDRVADNLGQHDGHEVSSTFDDAPVHNKEMADSAFDKPGPVGMPVENLAGNPYGVSSTFENAEQTDGTAGANSDGSEYVTI
jgi:hypothetical protein